MKNSTKIMISPTSMNNSWGGRDTSMGKLKMKERSTHQISTTKNYFF
jgi:hypothetical protein